MAQLPTEQDIGDLPDRLPRRMGVGSWQPGDLERGAENLARGGQDIGRSLAMIAGQDVNQQNQVDLAKAQSAVAVANVQTSQGLTNETDPTKVPLYRAGFQNNVDDAASLISDPDAQAKFRLTQAPEVARSQVAADNHQQGLVKNQALADFGQTSTNLINAAVSTDDDGQRAASLNAIKANGLSLVSRGLLTPEEWQKQAADIQHQYAETRVKSEILRAQQTGDTSRLKDLGKMFEFQPGEWGAGSAPIPGTQAAAGAQRVATYAAPIQAAATKYGVSADYLAKTAYIESGGDPSADNGFARGLMQFSDGTARQYGVNQKDPTSSIDGAAHYAADNRSTLTAALGRPPTDAELYLAHQQGPGAAKLLANPNTPAGQLVDAKAIRANGGDPNAPARQFTDMWIQKYNAAPSPFSGGGGAPTTPAVAPRTVMAAGDSLGVGIAQAAGQDNTGNKFAQVGIPPLPNPRNPSAPNVLDKINALPDGAGKTLVISTGASNAAGVDPATYVPQQIAAAKAKGYDPVVLGVGPKFASLNPKLQQQAVAAGARFQPLDAGMIGPDGVHPIAEGYKGLLTQVSAAGAGGAGAAAPIPSAFIGIPPPGAVGANPHLAPPQSQWPPDARGVEHNPDGSLSYVMSEGNRVPVPGSTATGAAGAPSPSGTGSVLDAMKPVPRAELGIQINNAIDQIDRQREAQNKQYATAAVSDMKARVQSMTSGRAIGPNEADSLKPYANSPIPEVRQAYAQTMLIRDNLASYQGKTPAQVQADVANKEAAYAAAREAHPNSPAIEAMGLVLNAAHEYAKQYATEAVKTPLERASKSGLLPQGVVAVDPSDPNIEATIARRVSDAQTAASSLGVPVKYLQQSERPAMKEIARQGGEPMVDLAMHIVRSAGPDAPAIFKEIGVDAPMFQWIGVGGASGYDSEAMRDVATVMNARNDKAAGRDLPTFTERMMAAKGINDPMKDAAGRFGPDFDARTRAAANMLMTAQASRDGWDPKTDPTNVNLNQQFFDRAYDLATGATFGSDGTKYGGIVDRNAKNWSGSSNRVIVPNTMKANDFPSVINSITDQDLRALPNAPMGKNGAPISANQIQSGQLEAFPDSDGIFRGKYTVRLPTTSPSDDGMVRNSAGKLWALDLAQPQLDAALRGRNPNSFLAPQPTAAPGRAGPAPAPAGPRYRSTPGMVALSGEAENE